MASNFLEQIVAHKRGQLVQKQAFYQALKKNVSHVDQTHYHVFSKAITKPGQVQLIAEIKKASPSQGVIRDDFNVEKIAKTYAASGAAAISVLTEEKYFLGKPAFLRTVSDIVRIPTLMKDFVIDEYQIYEGFSCGANAVLLIAAILSDAELTRLIKTADQLGMECLVEVHDEKELNRAVGVGARIIGINNRDLQTLEVRLATSRHLAPKVPKGTIVVAESGFSTHAQVQELAALGVHAVLIGETFMRAADIGQKVKEIMGTH